jgi:hypothetical protein
MKAPLIALLLLLCSAQTPQTDSLIYFADGSTLHCTKYETRGDLLIIHTGDGNQFTTRKSNVTKIEAVQAGGKKEENQMQVIGETGVPPQNSGPSLAEASALYGNAKGGGFTVLEDNARAPGGSKGGNRANGTAGRGMTGTSRIISRKDSDERRAPRSNDKANNDAANLEKIARQVTLGECSWGGKAYSVPRPTPKAPFVRDPVSEERIEVRSGPSPLRCTFRNDNDVSVCDVIVTLNYVGKASRRPATVKIGKIEARQAAAVTLPQSTEVVPRIEKVTCKICEPPPKPEIKELPW